MKVKREKVSEPASFGFNLQTGKERERERERERRKTSSTESLETVSSSPPR